MDVAQIITPDIKAANRLEFDRVTNILNGQGNIIAKIKNEIGMLRSRFSSMVEILTSYPDRIDVLEKQLYDVQCQAFIHTVFMYLGLRDLNGNLYINPVTPSSQTTDVSITIKLPHYTLTKTVAQVENIVVDIATWDMYIGSTVVTASRSSDLVEQYSVVAETPTPYFSRQEFITGVSYEVEKLILFTSQLCRAEQAINSGLRFVSELKNLGLYN